MNILFYIIGWILCGIFTLTFTKIFISIKNKVKFNLNNIIPKEPKEYILILLGCLYPFILMLILFGYLGNKVYLFILEKNILGYFMLK